MANPLALLHIAGGPKLPVITQSEAAECGLVCLAMVAGYHGLETGLAALRRRVPISAKGMTLHTVLVAAQRLGLTVRGLRLEPEALDQLRTPAILRLKLMLGLLTPQSGQVLVDGRPLDPAGMAAFRAQAGVVMQDDALLAGSIAENITFFDPRPDLGFMRECAALAGVDTEIMAMPMTYSTLVGDLGTALSGGQRQRLLLARALYRRPKILLMDEGTSHLDVAKEREVNAALAALDITRIVIAHRPETIAAADRVVVLRDGALHEPARMPVLAAAE